MSIYEEPLEKFRTTCKDFVHYSKTIHEVVIEDQLKWPLEFYRDYVSKSKPVIIKNGCKHFSAVNKWNLQYFLNNFSNKLIRVDVTPNGYADAVTQIKTDFTKKDKIFLMAEEKQMVMKDFLETLMYPQDNYICYIQSQNSNLTDILSEFAIDVEPDIKWASEAFNKEPDAINFWMGDSRATTSMHKDPYENIYCVIDGYKDFTLISPTDLAYVPYKEFDCGNYVNVTPDNYNVMPQYDGDKCRQISWIDVDPLKPDLEEYPNFAKAHVYNARISKGDCLYLPALWFHHVRQSHGAIAVNYWYDMEFDVKYCYHTLLENLIK